MRKFCFAIAATLVVLGSAEPVPAAGSTQVANAERPEHLLPASSAHVASRLAPQMPSDTALARLASARLRTQTAAAASTAAASVAAPFLTRPYIGYHVITSVFDHCNPDYTTDGSVCRFDGTVGLRGYGVDPSFSRGYAQTPGGGDYLYYDGHNGWDYGLSYENVRAAGDGVVSLAGADSINPCFGQTIILNHPNGFSTRYARLADRQLDGDGFARRRHHQRPRDANQRSHDRPDQRQPIHIHRDGDRRHRQRSCLLSVGQRDTERRTGPSHQRGGDPRRRLGPGQLDALICGGQPDHGIHGHRFAGQAQRG